ncbi:hypothetical protein BpHYR1_024483 [Brachionus plicatilis]|uniref:Uncharacterized protein n=1 Tax=Brachionus plicatilis TaxID=10195 RepID=A0A3M7SFF7_BRAPC|nr:hypothetical protein BpHYR1_024483 [Brachionus plicatilis]
MEKFNILINSEIQSQFLMKFSLKSITRNGKIKILERLHLAKNPLKYQKNEYLIKKKIKSVTVLKIVSSDIFFQEILTPPFNSINSINILNIKIEFGEEFKNFIQIFLLPKNQFIIFRIEQKFSNLTYLLIKLAGALFQIDLNIEP